MAQTASPSVSEPDYARLELGQLDLQELLGDSLVEAQYLKELQSLAKRKVTVLQEQSLCAAAHADIMCADVTHSGAQSAQDLQRELASKCCELAAACLDINRWKKQAALQQLRLVSVQEDLTHQKVYAQALSAECSRRQELNDKLQAQLQGQQQHNTKLDKRLAEAAAKTADLQTCMDSMHQTLKEKEGLLMAMEVKLQEAQSRLQEAEAAAAQQSGSAQQRHDAVQERACLAEQVAAAARERADIAEQRLNQRLELAQQRDQHAADLLQERHDAAAARAVASEQRLKEEVATLQHALQRAQYSRLADTHGAGKEGHDKLRQIMTELANTQQQLIQRDAHIAVLEGTRRHPAASPTPVKQGAKATGAAGAGKAAAAGLRHIAEQNKVIATSSRQHQDTASTSQQPSSNQRKGATLLQHEGVPSTKPQPDAEEEVGQSGGRPTRQRTEAQPYWMTGAAGNSPVSSSPPGKSPAARQSPANTKAALELTDTAPAFRTQTAAAAQRQELPAAAVHVNKTAHIAASAPVSGEKAEGVKGRKPGVAKRQAKASPNKEAAQQPAVKKSRAAQAEAAVSASSLPADAEAGPSQSSSEPQETAVVARNAAVAAPADAIAGALQKFGPRQPCRPVGVAKIDLATSFTQASASPASSTAPAVEAAVTSRPPVPGPPVAGPSVAGKTAGTAKGSLDEKPGLNKENETAQKLAQPGSHKPLMQRPKALNYRVVSAAAERRTDKSAEAQGAVTKVAGPTGAANKRRILKPINVDYNATGKHQDVLPASMLFGDAFTLPKLKR